MISPVEESYAFKSLAADEVNLDLTRQLQAVGADAWSSALPDRGPDQIRLMFDPNPDYPGQLIEKKEMYQTYAREGALVVAFSKEDGQVTDEAVGYIMVKNDVSGLFSAVKRILRPSSVYAVVTQINVTEAHQGNGVGTALLKKGMVAGEFPPTRVPTAYIFDENELAKRWFGNKGFRLSPPEQKPREEAAYVYFGAANPRVNQYRYAAPGVQHLTNPIRKTR